MTVNSSNTLTKCGMYSGYLKHLKLKEKPCQSCRDARNKYRREYYKLHPEKKKIADIKYVSKHRKQVAKYSAKYRQNNLEKSRAASLKWNKEHPEKMNAAARKRRAIKLQNGYSPYTEAEVLEKYGIICYLCNKEIDLLASRKTGSNGWELGLHIDHLVPIIAGGPDTIDNVRPTHALCNTKKGARMVDDFEPELSLDLFDDLCECEDECECAPEDYDDHALDEEELEEDDDEEEEDE